MKSWNRDWGPKSVCPAKIGTGRQVCDKESGIILRQGINRDGDRFWKKNQQLVRWHGRFHSTSTLLSSRFHAISCNWYVPIQSPALAAEKQCIQQPFMKTQDFSKVARAFTPWMQCWRFLEKLLHRTYFQPLRKHISRQHGSLEHFKSDKNI